MNDTNIMQQIRDLEQKIQAATEKVAQLEKRITEHRVGLSFNAVGKTDTIYEDEIHMDNIIRPQMSMKQKLATLYKEVRIR